MYRVCIVVLFIGAAACLLSAQATYPSNAGENRYRVPAGFPANTTINIYINSNDYPSGSSMNDAIRNGANNLASMFTDRNNSFNFIDSPGCPVVSGYWVYAHAGTPPGGLWELNSYAVQDPLGAATASVLYSDITLLPTFTDPGAV